MQTFDVIVNTVTPQTWKALFLQRIRWYKGSVDNTINYRKIMFKKEYGDYGYLRMPTVILSGIIAVILFATLFQDLVTKIIQWVASLAAVNFDIWTLIKNYSFEFNYLSLPFAKLFIAATLLSISLFVMIYSYKIVQEKINNHGRTLTGLVTYLFMYGIFMTFVWVYIAFIIVTKKKNTW